jgi:tetratricopeptide (TPR) repeat protein
LDDLTPAIELYRSLIGLGRYEDAYAVFRDRLDNETHFRLSAIRLRVELLEALFPNGLDELPRLTDQMRQGYTLNGLALGYQYSGKPGSAISLFKQGIDLAGRAENVAVGLANLAEAVRLVGKLRESEAAARRALGICHNLDDRFGEGASLRFLCLALACRGAVANSLGGLERALRIAVEGRHRQREGVASADLAQQALLSSDAAAAIERADRAWDLAEDQRNEGDFIRASRLQGEAALALGDLPSADERLHHALTRARAGDHTEEELPALDRLGRTTSPPGQSQRSARTARPSLGTRRAGPLPPLPR